MIELSKNIILYKYKLEYSKECIVNEVHTTLNTFTRILTSPQPGVQAKFRIKNGEWDRVHREISNTVLTDVYKDPKKTYISSDWVYVSSNLNRQTGFHHHLKMEDMNIRGEWSYTFYVQMPDNLKGDDGKLIFKGEDGLEYFILPEEGDLFIFDAKYLHSPATNLSSKLDRIVLAGTFCKVDILERKTNNTLI